MRTLIAGLAPFALLCPIALADPVHDAIDAYALYQNDVSALIDLHVESGRTVDAALTRLSRHDPARVARGWIAYGALTAAQSPAFAAGVQRSLHSDRADFLRDLQADPRNTRQQNGSAQAIQLILDAANADGARASAAGDRYDRFARSASRVQMVSSVLRVDIPNARLTPAMLSRLHIGALGGEPTHDASALGGRSFWDSLFGHDERPSGALGSHERPRYTPVTDRMLTLGALIVANADNDRTQVNALLNDPITTHCMAMNQLELRQCLSVSVDSSERAYCVGRHALTGPGVCISAMAR
ncbi:MAG: hypothetical protein QM759_07040 [Terricaulis sp.]